MSTHHHAVDWEARQRRLNVYQDRFFVSRDARRRFVETLRLQPLLFARSLFFGPNENFLSSGWI